MDEMRLLRDIRPGATGPDGPTRTRMRARLADRARSTETRGSALARLWRRLHFPVQAASAGVTVAVVVVAVVVSVRVLVPALSETPATSERPASAPGDSGGDSGPVPSTGAPATPSDGEWVVGAKLRGSFTIRDVAMFANGPDWAGGRSGNPDSGTVMLRRAQGSWKRVDVPDVGAIMAVGGSSATNVWAAGERLERDASGYDTVLWTLHWNGRSWSRIRADVTPGAVKRVRDIVATPTTVWMVGIDGSHGMIQRWTGTRWVQVETPALRDVQELSAVAAASPDSVWAVGSEQSGDDLVVLHWDGESWSRVPVPDLGYHPVLEVWLRDVIVTDSGTVYAVGGMDYQRRTGVPSFRTPGPASAPRPLPAHKSIILRWDGEGWSLVEETTGSGIFRFLTTVGNELWAISPYGVRGPSAVRLVDGDWVSAPLPVKRDTLVAVDNAGDTIVLVSVLWKNKRSDATATVVHRYTLD